MLYQYFIGFRPLKWCARLFQQHIIAYLSFQRGREREREKKKKEREGEKKKTGRGEFLWKAEAACCLAVDKGRQAEGEERDGERNEVFQLSSVESRNYERHLAQGFEEFLCSRQMTVLRLFLAEGRQRMYVYFGHQALDTEVCCIDIHAV